MIQPLRPTVTLDEFLAFDKDRPETFTASPVVNAVAEAFATVRPFSEKEIARQLHVDGKKLSYALEIITGYSFTTLRYYWLEKRLVQIEAERPYISPTDKAHLLGFADGASLWHFLRSPGYKKKKRINVRKDSVTEMENHERQMEIYDQQLHTREIIREARHQRMKELEEQANNGDKDAEAELLHLRRIFGDR